MKKTHLRIILTIFCACAIGLVISAYATQKGENQMTEAYKPEGIQSLVPYVFMKDIPKYLVFVQEAFGVEIITETKNDDGVTFYATLKFDDTTYFVQEPDEGNPVSNTTIYLYVPNLDAAYKKAVAAGAISVAEPAEQYHGDSFAILKDKWNNQWYLAYASVILDDDQVRERRQKKGHNPQP